MPRTLDPGYIADVQLAVTTPTFLIDFYHSGTIEYLSTGGAITYNSHSHVSGADMVALSDSEATIRIPATSTRITEIQDGDWRNETCTIYAYYDATTAATIMEGTIDASRLGGDSITVRVLSTNILGKYTPVYTYDAICTNLPVDGEYLEWQSETIVVTSVRVNSWTNLLDYLRGGGRL